ERLMEELWHDHIVEDANLTVAISLLRKALANNGSGGDEFIETIPRVGYRFVGEAREVIEPVAGGSNGHIGHQRPDTEIEPTPSGAIAGASAPIEEKPAARFSRKAKWFGGLAAAAVLLLGAGAVYEMQSRREPVDAPSITSVAVLPLKTLSGGTDDYLVDGLTEGLINSLSRLEGLKVISRGSVFPYKNQEIDPHEVGRRLGVMAIVEGSVQMSGENARVLLRLVSTRDGNVLWATETSDQPQRDLFRLQDGLARSVSAALRPALAAGSAARPLHGQTTVAEAYQAYLKGRFFWNKRTFDDLEKSILYFNQAIEQDPTYALAYAGLADSYALLNYYGGSDPAQSYAKARRAAEQALEIDESQSEVHTSLAYIKRAYDWDWAGAEREFKRAIELNANYATAHFWYGEFLTYFGRFEEGIAEIQRAEELDPLSPIISGSLGWAYYMARQHDRALAQLQKTLDLDRNYAMTHFILGMAYEGKGRYPEAIAAYLKSQEISPLGPGIVGLGHAYAVSGREAEARLIFEELKERMAKNQSQPTSLMIVAAGL
ncbi:MAG: tetratricopeptide repeat protein, partial [Nocardioidaceae bacterium]